MWVGGSAGWGEGGDGGRRKAPARAMEPESARGFGGTARVLLR